MKILMTKDQRGSNDGFTVIDFEKGKEYEVAASLGTVFIQDLKCAEEVLETPENQKTIAKAKAAKA